MIYSIALAGSTEKTLQIAQTLLADGRFKISLIITPQPKPIGRKQTLTKNPVHKFAQKNKLPIVLIDRKIDQDDQKKIEANFTKQAIDFLLVVDFGYLIPKWMLRLPKIAPLNVHPSLLPSWRGSSPGQFVLLGGDRSSAVALIVMSEKMDEGPILGQFTFGVDQAWTQTEYYQYSFDLICEKLGNLIYQFAEGKIRAIPQPDDSPTPLARRLTKQDSFYDWSIIKKAMKIGEQATEIERACRAFSPWPKLWTKVTTNQGEKRMIIHRCHLENLPIDQADLPAGQTYLSDEQVSLLILDQVQLEGKNKTTWKKIKTNILK
ncbi:MAG: formyltransferase family protein [Candidatus Paceibacterota bacterium]